MTSIDRRPRPVSAAIAGVLVTVLGLLVAGSFGISTALRAVAGFLGTAGVVYAAAVVSVDPERTTNRERAGASVLLAGSTLVAVLSVSLLRPDTAVVLVPMYLAVVFVGIGANVVPPTQRGAVDASVHFTELCRRNRDSIVVSSLLLSIATLGVIEITLGGVLDLWLLVLGSSALLSLLLLEGLLYAVLVLLPLAQQTLDDRLATSGTNRLVSVTLGGVAVSDLLPDVRRQVHDRWWLGAAQVVLLVVAPRILDEVLGTIPGVGPFVRTLFSTGLLHVPVLVVVVLSLLVLGFGAVHSALLRWAGIDPPRVLASGTGGVLVGGATALTILAPSVVGPFVPPSVVPAVTSVFRRALVFVALEAAVLFALPIVLFRLGTLPWLLGVATERTESFVMAGASILVGVIAAGSSGVPAILVFAGVAVVMLTWDLGEQSSFLGVHLGDAPDTRDVEVAHALGTVAVGVGGVALAGLMAYLLGPIVASTTADRAGLSIALALGATVSFVVVLTRERGAGLDQD